MTLFGALLRRLGLSQSDASTYLDVRLDTVKSWASGRRRVPSSVIGELRELNREVGLEARRLHGIWEEEGEPEIFTPEIEPLIAHAIVAELTLLLPSQVELELTSLR